MLVARPSAPFLAILASLSLVTSCTPAPEKSEPPHASSATSVGVRPPASGAASAAPSIAASAAGPATGAEGSLRGTWEGRYEAKKGSIEIPPKVKDKARAGDDGKAMSGPGKIELTISAEGDLRGKASGALGDATLSGKVDAGEGAAAVVRASWFPADPTAANAMTGVLIGVRKGAVLHAQIRVAGPDATLVREAELDLERH